MRHFNVGNILHKLNLLTFPKSPSHLLQFFQNWTRSEISQCHQIASKEQCEEHFCKSAYNEDIATADQPSNKG